MNANFVNITKSKNVNHELDKSHFSERVNDYICSDITGPFNSNDYDTDFNTEIFYILTIFDVIRGLCGCIHSRISHQKK